MSEEVKIVSTYRALSPKHIEQIREVSRRAKVEVVTEKEKIFSAVEDAEIMVDAGMFDRQVFMASRGLRWVHAVSAGVERYLFPEFVQSPIMLTNSSGVHGIPISEMILALMLMLTKQLHKSMRFQLAGRWDKLFPDELAGKNVGILGLGNIGMETAWRAKCFGMKVLALEKRAMRRPVYVDEILGPEDLAYFLSESDYLVVTLPLTGETYHMIDEKELRLMKPNAYLINVSRGAVVDNAALIKALTEGWIAGAGLDVFEKEPLPEDSEFWKLGNVIVTPHISGSTPYYADRVTQIFCKNLVRYLEGKPLVNLVDKNAGY